MKMIEKMFMLNSFVHLYEAHLKETLTVVDLDKAERNYKSCVKICSDLYPLYENKLFFYVLGFNMRQVNLQFNISRYT